MSASQLSSYGYYELFRLGLREVQNEVEFVIYIDESAENSDELLSVPGQITRRHLVSDQIFLTFAAAGPFCPLTSSNSTLCPSERDLKPSP